MNDIKDIVRRVVGDMAAQKVPSSVKIENVWLGVLEKKESEHVRLVGFKNGVLMVDVDSSAWLYHMNTRKSKIIELLQQGIPDIKKINFKIGKVK